MLFKWKRVEGKFEFFFIVSNLNFHEAEKIINEIEEIVEIFHKRLMYLDLKSSNKIPGRYIEVNYCFWVEQSTLRMNNECDEVYDTQPETIWKFKDE